MAEITLLSEAVKDLIHDGGIVAMEGFTHLIPFAAGHEIALLDPNFSGAGRFLTDDSGYYRFTSIKPGAYPWRTHANAWRPAHIHISLFGAGLLTRLVTQMYFPGDPLLAYDPIYNCIEDEKARQRMISSFDL
jgi:protocatechuate 3,4-dioxygenase beta subunit